MFGFHRKPQLHEDPAVSVIEDMLSAAAPAQRTPERLSGQRDIAVHALWICACITVDDSPTWLIYDTPEGELCWLRVPDGVEQHVLVDARLSAGGHADPADVVTWLRCSAPDPWSTIGSGSGDPRVLDQLRSKIRAPR